jgi:hypothetical protein
VQHPALCVRDVQPALGPRERDLTAG